MYRKVTILSLDIAAGSVVSMLFFARIFQVPIGWPEMAAMALTVWVIYTADHLLDAVHLKDRVQTDRHRFHLAKRKLMTVITVAALIADAAVVTELHHNLQIGGALLLGGVIVYLIIQYRIGVAREFTVAVLYTTGILLPSLMREGGGIDRPVVLAFQFLLVVLSNLLLISLYDRPIDEAYGKNSISTRCGEKTTRGLITVLLGMQILCTFYMVRFVPQRAFSSIIILLMHTILGVILWKRGFFNLNERFRLFGDAVFFVPLVYLLWPR